MQNHDPPARHRVTAKSGAQRRWRGRGVAGLGPATFFRKEVYGKDQLVLGGSPERPNPEFLAKTPLSRLSRLTSFA